MEQYLELCRRVLRDGTWVENTRTSKWCLTVINADLEYDMGSGAFPVLTTKKLHWKPAIAEMLGYLRGYSSAAQFRALGCNTWNANANENKAWLDNPRRRGEDDMGRCYGVQGRRWAAPGGKTVDQLRKIYEHLRYGVDDRSEVLTFWNPGELDQGCLNPCMHTHTFNIIGDRLYLTSYQRSCDIPLGLGFNIVQVGWLLLIMAQITGLKPGKAYHKIVNAHIYEDQMGPLVDVQMERAPLPQPRMAIDPGIKTLEDLEAWVKPEHFSLPGYQHSKPVKFAFSV